MGQELAPATGSNIAAGCRGFSGPDPSATLDKIQGTESNQKKMVRLGKSNCQVKCPERERESSGVEQFLAAPGMNIEAGIYTQDHDGSQDQDPLGNFYIYDFIKIMSDEWFLVEASAGPLPQVLLHIG